jgi:hypothetical protein
MRLAYHDQSAFVKHQHAAYLYELSLLIFQVFSRLFFYMNWCSMKWEFIVQLRRRGSGWIPLSAGSALPTDLKLIIERPTTGRMEHACSV